MKNKKICLDCGEVKSKKGLYCKKCGYSHRKRPSGLTYKIKSENHSWFVKGQPSWNKGIYGIHCSPNTEFKVGVHNSPDTEFKKGNIPLHKGKELVAIQNEKHPNWKGDSVGYGALHSWIKRKFGLANKCCQCGSDKNVDWANKSRTYKRDLSDWMQLCKKCHRVYDGANEKMIISRIRNRELKRAIA